MKRRIENRVITCYFTTEELNRIVMLLGENAVCMKLPSYVQLKNYMHFTIQIHRKTLYTS